jgi:hypothetical protein
MQLRSLQESPEMHAIMTQIVALYNDVSEVVKDLVYRKDLAVRVDTSNRAYIDLFQEMLTETLKIQRLRFKVINIAKWTCII